MMKKFNIRDFLNKIIWDPREKPKKYIIRYLSRGMPNNFVEIRGNTIIKVYHRGFEYRDLEGEKTYIPFHRILEIRNCEGEIFYRKREISMHG